MVPVPYVVKEPPCHLLVRLHYLTLRPKIPWAKLRELLEVGHNLAEVSCDLGLALAVALRITADAPDDVLAACKTVY